MMRAAWRAGDCADLSTWAQGAKDQELAPECWLLGVSVATRYPGGPHLVSLSPCHLYYLQIATPAPTTHCQLETCRTRSMQRRSPCEYSHHRHLVNVISIIPATLHSMKIMISLSLEIMCSNFMSCLCSAGQSEYCDCELSTFNH